MPHVSLELTKFDYWGGRKNLLYKRINYIYIPTYILHYAYTYYILHIYIYLYVYIYIYIYIYTFANSHPGGIDDGSCSFWSAETMANNWC